MDTLSLEFTRAQEVIGPNGKHHALPAKDQLTAIAQSKFCIFRLSTFVN